MTTCSALQKGRRPNCSMPDARIKYLVRLHYDNTTAMIVSGLTQIRERCRLFNISDVSGMVGDDHAEWNTNAIEVMCKRGAIKQAPCPLMGPRRKHDRLLQSGRGSITHQKWWRYPISRRGSVILGPVRDYCGCGRIAWAGPLLFVSVDTNQPTEIPCQYISSAHERKGHT
jgi:hypothetical protein